MSELVIDTSAVVAVVTNAPEKKRLIRSTDESTLVAPSSVHWEVGNAFSAMFRRGRIDLELIERAIEIYRRIPIRFVDVNLSAALRIASRHRIYAYDAYLIECAIVRKATLLTLDRSLARVALEAGAQVMEV